MQRHMHKFLLDTHSAKATDAVRFISTRIAFQCHQIMQHGGYVDVRKRVPLIANLSLTSTFEKSRILKKVVFQFE